MDNRLRFATLVKTQIKRDGIDKLLEWLDTTDWYTAPESTRFHLSVEGGLLQHSLNVYDRLIRLYEMEYGVIPDKKKETLTIISLFHDACKTNCYKPEWKNRKVYSENGSKQDEGGRFDWESYQSYGYDEKFAYGWHGAKSVYMIERFIKLTPEEATAICNHMGMYDSQTNVNALGRAYEQYPLALLLHIADSLASHIDEKEEVKK